ncbi:hypothetical protein [Planctomyces sp. SH-PL62]|uniref:hypothetical protein n=1 Tax=Planctomyces sp. SH-PL62 TaxID=1636152 RepID=UPI00078BE31F|nr:hypothetical protein [Planctomyces sp. SH-PL62]AMV39894.1 hypothetical protein VT85_20850 [Planctomyces sp. SH-PL62]
MAVPRPYRLKKLEACPPGAPSVGRRPDPVLEPADPRAPLIRPDPIPVSRWAEVAAASPAWALVIGTAVPIIICAARGSTTTGFIDGSNMIIGSAETAAVCALAEEPSRAATTNAAAANRADSRNSSLMLHPHSQDRPGAERTPEPPRSQ